MNAPKVGIMTFGDPRDHEWKSFISNYAIPRHKQAVEYFSSKGLEVISCEDIPRSNNQIDEQADWLKSQNIEVFIAHTSTWSWPSMVLRAVQKIGLPTIVLGNDHPGTASLVGLLGSAGALSQIGYPHLRVMSDFDELESGVYKEKMLPYIRAASAKIKLKGKVMGFYGGRSLGIDTGSFDPIQWKREFGVDADHVDQLEIIRRSELIEPERTEKMREWLTGKVRSVKYDEKLTKDKLDYQIRCYLATKDIIDQQGHDFVAIKCMPDLTTHFVPQCLSAAFLPAPFDADGPKEPIPMACEADADGALTMEILTLVSEGMAPMFADVSSIDKENKMFYLPNCGAINAWFAKRSDNPDENLQEIDLVAANRPAGGAIPLMRLAPGEITLARLYRKAGKYTMAIVPAQVVTPGTEIYETYKKSRGEHLLPTAFIKLHDDFDFDAFIDEFGANHISAVGGIFTKELVNLCEMLNIESVVM